MPALPIGIVGLNFGHQIAREDLGIAGEASPYFRLGAVCDLDPVLAKQTGQALGVPAYTSLDALLADPTIPAIGLFTGPAGRAPLLERIIRAGKDVMTTKPFELDAMAARSVLEEAAARGRVIHLNSPSVRPSPAMQQMLDWQRDLGRPVGARGEVFCSYREEADGTWKDDPAHCPMGPLYRLGVYLINDLIRLFGPIRAIQPATSQLFTGRPTPDNAQLGLVFENGALGSVFASFCVDDGQYYSGSLHLHYERGTISRNLFPVAYGEGDLQSRLVLTIKRGENRVETIRKNFPILRYDWRAFHDSIAGLARIPMPIDEIVHGVEVLAAMSEAGPTEFSQPVAIIPALE